jgi:hypothetical protein
MLVSLAVILAPSTTHLIVFGLVAWLVLVIIILPFILAAFHYRDNPPAVPPYKRSIIPPWRWVHSNTIPTSLRVVPTPPNSANEKPKFSKGD